MAGQRTTLSLGGVAAEVSLVKMSGKPKDAQHEVRWPDPPVGAPEGEGDPVGDLAMSSFETKGDAGTSGPGAPPPVDVGRGDPLGGTEPEDPAAGFAAAVGVGGSVEPPPEPVKPMHGVTLESGKWVDLTDRLEQIDEACKLPGMEVVSTVPSASIPRERVVAASWVASTDPRAARVLALLWRGLDSTTRVAAVRWTKRTNQALGVLVPRTLPGGKRALALLEMEWAENMRPAPASATGPMDADVSDAEMDAAKRLVEALAGKPSELDELRDERLAKRAELLNLAREGKVEGYVAPEPPADAEPVEDVVARWEAQAAARS